MFFDKLREHTKIVIFIVVIAFGIGGAFMGLGGLFFGGTPQHQGAAPQTQNVPVAEVEGETISYQELYYFFQMYQEQYPQQLRGMQQLPFMSQLLNSLINERLVAKEASNRGIEVEVSEERIDEQLGMMMEAYASSEEEFMELLAASNYTMEDLRADLRSDLKREETSSVLREQVVGEVEVNEADLSEKRAEIRASHILISPEREGAEDLVEELEDRLQAGEDFSQLAEEYSDCPSADDGGDLGFFTRGQMVAPFEEAAFSLEEGEISEPVETEFGLHLIRLEERKAMEEMEPEEREEELARLASEKEEEVYQQWLAERRKEAEIDIKDPAIRAHRYREEGDLELARETMLQALQSDPDHAYYHAHLGEMELDLNNNAAAIEYYQEAAELAPYDLELLINLADLYREEGEKDKALETYNEVQEWAGDDLMLHYQLLTAYQALEAEDRIEEQQKKVEELQEQQLQHLMEQQELPEDEEAVID